MKKLRYLFPVAVLLFSLSRHVFALQSAQDTDTTDFRTDWFLRDPETDNVQGLSVEKAYATVLKGRPSRTVTVAVIDSGIDFEHEDLQGVMWMNPKEIAGNGVDDDKNGYTDDIYGWNFIGGKNGNVKRDTYELTREYARLRTKYKNLAEPDVPKKDKAEYAYWLEI
ncbi:MAG TPA: peptidase S8, partial [Cyclobacteriaceae bacterium]|nr:peptidase S8 [Cyclobacteriaceae bacterium]